MEQKVIYYYVNGVGRGAGYRDVIVKYVSKHEWYYRANTKREVLRDQCCCEQDLSDSKIISKEEANKICRNWAKSHANL